MKATPFRIAGAALLIVGLPMWGLGTYLLVKNSAQEARAEAFRAKVDAQCASAIAAIPGASVHKQNDDLRVDVRDIADPRVAIGDASTMIGYCPNRVMTYFCLGSDCPGSRFGSVTMFFHLSPR